MRFRPNLAPSDPKTGPLLVFVHVPKSGGSAVNRMLAAQMPDGLPHCQRLKGRQASLTRALTGADWVSGHVPFPWFRDMLGKATGRPLRFATCLRDPAAQVASHYNWLIRIRQRPVRFLRYPKEIRQLSHRIANSDNTSARTVIANLKAGPTLFLNVQSRYVLGPRGTVEDVLPAYAAIGTSDDTPGLVARLTGTRVRPLRDNDSPYHFDPAVFRTPQLTEFLSRENARDVALYRHVRALTHAG